MKWQRKNLKKARIMAKVKIKVKATVKKTKPKKTKSIVASQKGDSGFITNKTASVMKGK